MTVEQITAVTTRLGQRLLRARARASALGRPLLVSVTRRQEPMEAVRFYAAGRATGEDCIYWEQPGKRSALVGVGAAHVLGAGGAGQAAEAVSGWRDLLDGGEIDIEDDPGGTGPLLMGGFAFDPQGTRTSLWNGYPDGVLTLPRFMLTNRGDRSWLTTNVVVRPDCNVDEVAVALARDRDRLLPARTLRAPTPPHAGGYLRRAVDSIGRHQTEHASLTLEDTRPIAVWKAAVERAAAEARAGRVEKVVLARAVRASSGVELRPEVVLERLRTAYPECFVFAVARGEGCFLGATPERLVSLDSGQVRADCLAGSRPRGRDGREDARRTADLQSSPKDRAEHEIVLRMLTRTLREACRDVVVPEAPRVMKVHNVLHLYTPVTARARPGQTALDLACRLHPTPAVGGSPRRAALELIRECEGLDRGWYAGPVGWMDREGNGELAVALRSALVRGREAVLFAGCGIVAASDPESEYAESCLKLRPVLAALEGRLE